MTTLAFMRTGKYSRLCYCLQVFCLALVLILGEDAAHACSPNWDTYTAITGGTITAPATGTNVPISSEVTCTITAATDQDHRYAPSGNPQHTYPYDTALTYTWSAKVGATPVGSWKNGINTGLSVIWVAPATPTSNVTISCTISDTIALPPGETGIRNDTDAVLSVTISKVYNLAISASNPTIMTGGIANTAHRSIITATVTPIMTGNVTFSKTGGAGHSVAASLSATTVALNGSGQAQTTLTSSDKVENVTVNATFLALTRGVPVTQTYWDQQTFSINPSELLADGQTTGQVSFTILQHGTSTPVVGHSISFEIASILDEAGTPIDSSQWSNYCTVSSSPATTNSSGVATCTFQAGQNRCTVNLKAHDNNVWQAQ